MEVPATGYRREMATSRKRMMRTKHAAVIGLLIAAPVLPLTGCGDSGDSGGERGTEVEEGDDRNEGDDEGPY